MVDRGLDHYMNLAGTAADFGAEGEGMLVQQQTGVLDGIAVESLGFAAGDTGVGSQADIDASAMAEDLASNYHGESRLKKVDGIAEVGGYIFGRIALEGTHYEVVLAMTVEQRPPGPVLVLYSDLLSD